MVRSKKPATPAAAPRDTLSRTCLRTMTTRGSEKARTISRENKLLSEKTEPLMKSGVAARCVNMTLAFDPLNLICSMFNENAAAHRAQSAA